MYYDTRDGAFMARLETGTSDTSFVNDLTIAPSGTVYATDSRDSIIYRIHENGSGIFQLERWLPLAGMPIRYRPGFNLNGIAATANGLYLLTVQSNTGKLFRISIMDRSIAEVSLGGDSLTNGDGLF